MRRIPSRRVPSDAAVVSFLASASRATASSHVMPRSTSTHKWTSAARSSVASTTTVSSVISTLRPSISLMASSNLPSRRALRTVRRASIHERGATTSSMAFCCARRRQRNDGRRRGTACSTSFAKTSNTAFCWLNRKPSRLEERADRRPRRRAGLGRLDEVEADALEPQLARPSS